jgi:hypothetical protein
MRRRLRDPHHLGNSASWTPHTGYAEKSVALGHCGPKVSQRDGAIDAYSMPTGDHQRLDISCRSAPARLFHGSALATRAAGVVAEFRDQRKAVRRARRENEWHDQKPPHERDCTTSYSAVRKSCRSELLAGRNLVSSHTYAAERQDSSGLGITRVCATPLDPGDGSPH